MKIKDLTQAQALKALDKDPEHCPYCGSDFDGEGVDVGVKSCQQECTCQGCSASFYINYKYSDADFINGPGGEEDDDEDDEP